MGRASGAVAMVATLAALLCSCTLEAPKGTAYPVATRIQIERNGRSIACTYYPDAFPSFKCDGVPLENVDASRLPIEQTLNDGTIWSPVVRLTGVWTGSALWLTRTPTPSSTQAGMPSPPHTNLPAKQPDARFYRDQTRLNGDDAQLRTRGIMVIENGWDGSGFVVVVAVADKTSVKYLRATYGVKWVGGWLKPVS